METTVVPDASAVLVYQPSFMTTDSPDGLWLCTDAADAAAIQINAAALALGGGVAELRQAAPFLEAFPFVLVVGASQERRLALAQLVQQAVPSVEVCVTEQAAYRGCQSVVELRDTYGLAAVDALALQQYELPPWGLLSMSRVEAVDMAALPCTPSGIQELDRLIGGFYGGEVSVWTGRRKEGKSTMLGLPILAALGAGKRVCVYSGELPAWRYKAWLVNMAAGPEHLTARTLPSGRQVWTPQPEVQAQIDLWWQDRLFVVDNEALNIHQSQTLLRVFRYCARRFQCSMYVVDNLMTVELPTEDYYRAQGRFVGQLSAFAHETGAHVHLVAHRRKGTGRGEADEVSGSSEITNRADNLLCVSRESGLNTGWAATLEVLNNRDFGQTGAVRMHFDAPSRRFYSQSPTWACGWEEGPQQTQLEVPPAAR